MYADPAGASRVDRVGSVAGDRTAAAAGTDLSRYISRYISRYTAPPIRCLPQLLRGDVPQEVPGGGQRGDRVVDTGGQAFRAADRFPGDQEVDFGLARVDAGPHGDGTDLPGWAAGFVRRLIFCLITWPEEPLTIKPAGRTAGGQEVRETWAFYLSSKCPAGGFSYQINLE